MTSTTSRSRARCMRSVDAIRSQRHRSISSAISAAAECCSPSASCAHCSKRALRAGAKWSMPLWSMVRLRSWHVHRHAAEGISTDKRRHTFFLGRCALLRHLRDPRWQVHLDRRPRAAVLCAADREGGTRPRRHSASAGMAGPVGASMPAVWADMKTRNGGRNFAQRTRDEWCAFASKGTDACLRAGADAVGGADSSAPSGARGIRRRWPAGFRTRRRRVSAVTTPLQRLDHRASELR